MKTATADIYVRLQGYDNEFVRVPSKDLPENPYDLTYLLKLETAPRSCWRDVAAAYFRQQKWSAGIAVLEEATSDNVESVLRGGEDDQAAPGPRCSRLDLLASLAGAHIMAADAASRDAAARADALRRAAEVFSRADKIDLDDPSIWAVRGWAEFHDAKHTAVNWFDNARDKNVVIGAMGLAAIQLNRSKVPEAGKKDAVTLLVAALRSNHCPPGVWTGLAYALYREGRLKIARNVARRAIVAVADSSPDERREALYVAALIETVDKTASSVENVSVALREAYVECGGSEDPRILSLIAEMHFNGGDFEAAERFGTRAVASCENYLGSSVGSMFAGIKNGMRASAYFQLARAQHHLGKVDDAILGLEQVRKLASDGDGVFSKANSGAFLRLGLLKLSTGRPGDEKVAQECLEKVIKDSNDQCGIAKRALGVLLGRRVLVGIKRGRPRGGEHYQKALSCLKKGLAEGDEAEKDVPAQLVYAGLIEEASPKLALEAYRKAVKTLEEEGQVVDPEVWNNMSSLMARLGDVAEAWDLSNSKIEASYAEECRTVAYNRGRLAEMAGNLDEAVEIFEGIQKGNPHYHDAITRLAVMAMGDENKAGVAEKLLQEAMESPSSKAVAAACLSKLYQRQKKYPLAQQILEGSRHECDYLALSFASFFHSFLDSLDADRRGRFLLNHIASSLVSILKRNRHNSFAANGVGVFFAELQMISEARDAFTAAGAGPLMVKTARVNLAHTQVQLGTRAIRDSAKVTGRPSRKVVSNSRALFEQADKLYRDALAASNLTGSKTDVRNYCELMLYISWAQFEASEFRKAADILSQLVHLMPSSALCWFNLGQALLESASFRVIKGKAVLQEMRLAKDEFDGSRQAFLRSIMLDRRHPDPLGRTSISSRLAAQFERFVRQQAKTHEVNLRNAIDNAEDLDVHRKRSLAILEKRKEKIEEEKRKAERLRTKKEEELRKAFEQSAQRKEEYRLRQEYKMKQEALLEDDEEEDATHAATKKPKGKRKKKELALEDEETPPKKPRKLKRSSVSKKTAGGSGSEYSDVPPETSNGTANGGKRSYSDDSDDDVNAPKRKRFALADEDVSDGGF